MVIGQSEINSCNKLNGMFVNDTCVILNVTNLASSPATGTLNHTASYGFEVQTEHADNLTTTTVLKTVSPAEEFFK